jgi:hypothetical protein
VLTGWAWVLLCECRVSGCAAVCGPGRLAASKLLLHTLLPCLSHCLWPKNLNAPPPPPPPYAGWHLQAMTLKQTRLHMHPSLSLTHRDTLTHTQSLQPTTHCQHNRGRLSYTLFLVVLQRTYSTVAPPPPPPAHHHHHHHVYAGCHLQAMTLQQALAAQAAGQQAAAAAAGRGGASSSRGGGAAAAANATVTLAPAVMEASLNRMFEGESTSS